MKQLNNEIVGLTRDERINYLAKYLNRYIDEVITKFTNNCIYTEEVLNDNTIMNMIKYVIDNEENNINNIKRALDAPFNTEYSNYSYKSEYNHILNELIIK